MIDFARVPIESILGYFSGIYSCFSILKSGILASLSGPVLVFQSRKDVYCSLFASLSPNSSYIVVVFRSKIMLWTYALGSPSILVYPHRRPA